MLKDTPEIKAERVTETLTVYQQKSVFSFGTDAMLLADYVSGQPSTANAKKLCDLCSGTGILSLVLCDRFPNLTADVVEINPDAARLSEKSAAESGLAARFTAHTADIKQIRTLFASESFDFVVCNPPYMRADSGKHCDHPMINLARHEIACSVYDAFAAAFYLLRTGGLAYFVYRTDRLSSLMDAAKKNRFEIKDMRFFALRPQSDAMDLVVCKAKKEAAEGMKVSFSRLGT